MIRSALPSRTIFQRAAVRQSWRSQAPLASRLVSQPSQPYIRSIVAAQRRLQSTASQAKATEEPPAGSSAASQAGAAETKTATDAAAAKESDEAAAKTKAEIEGYKKEIAELKDRYLRSVAEMRNVQERSKREIQAARDFALQKFAKDLIESVDNLDRALGTVPTEKIGKDNADLDQLYNGLKMTDSVIMQTLKKHGLERVDPAETKAKFDPNVHEATFQAPQPDKEDGTVFHTQQKGWLLNGRVIRAAKVGVVKNS